MINIEKLKVSNCTMLTWHTKPPSRWGPWITPHNRWASASLLAWNHLQVMVSCALAENSTTYTLPSIPGGCSLHCRACLAAAWKAGHKEVCREPDTRLQPGMVVSVVEAGSSSAFLLVGRSRQAASSDTSSQVWHMADLVKGAMRSASMHSITPWPHQHTTGRTGLLALLRHTLRHATQAVNELSRADNVSESDPAVARRKRPEGECSAEAQNVWRDGKMPDAIRLLKTLPVPSQQVEDQLDAHVAAIQCACEEYCRLLDAQQERARSAAAGH